MKDNFSERSNLYKAFRPTYPAEMYDFILERVPEKKCAWDCGTGNGQVALELAGYFNKVHATDISKQQLEQAPSHPNIVYSIQRAGEPAFPDDYFNLITVAQAIHWFQFDEFFEEVNRTIRLGGIFCVIGYGLIQTFPEADQIISRFYREIIGSYWDPERKYIDENYQTIPFPFPEIESPKFTSIFEWKFEQLIGYLSTWSAVKHYESQNDQSPLNLIYNDLKKCWNDKIRAVDFPVFTRITQVEK